MQVHLFTSGRCYNQKVSSFTESSATLPAAVSQGRSLHPHVVHHTQPRLPPTHCVLLVTILKPVGGGRRSSWGWTSGVKTAKSQVHPIGPQWEKQRWEKNS